jgi:hypothetical protein
MGYTFQILIPRSGDRHRRGNMSRITLDIPDEALADLMAQPDAAAAAVRLATAIGLYAAGRLTHVQACALAGVGRVEFSQRLCAAHIPEHYRTTDDLALEFADA